MGGVIPAGSATGQTIYGQIRSAVDATIANGAGLETYNPARWGNYVNAMPEQSGSGVYILSVPGYLGAGRYFVIPFLQISGSPALGDTPLDILFFDWDGANVIGLGSGLNIGQINGSSTAAVNLSDSARVMVPGIAAAGTLTSSQMTTNLTATVANIFSGRVLYFTSGLNAGLACLVTSYAVTGGKLTFIAYGNQPAPNIPSIGDSFVIVG